MPVPALTAPSLKNAFAAEFPEISESSIVIEAPCPRDVRTHPCIRVVVGPPHADHRVVHDIDVAEGSGDVRCSDQVIRGCIARNHRVHDVKNRTDALTTDHALEELNALRNRHIIRDRRILYGQTAPCPTQRIPTVSSVFNNPVVLPEIVTLSRVTLVIGIDGTAELRDVHGRTSTRRRNSRSSSYS